MSEDLYFIQDTRTFVGNSMVWWREGGHGYTCNLNEAWTVLKETADRMHQNRKTDVPRKVSEMLSLAESHVDWQNVRDIKHLRSSPKNDVG